MKKSNKILLMCTFALIVIFFLFYFYNQQNTVSESTTELIQVISKDKNSEEQWIVLSNDKKIYIEDFSIWALIEENKEYTISYYLMGKSGIFRLKTIVPSDYEGQF